jgi:hypothetical protein
MSYGTTSGIGERGECIRDQKTVTVQGSPCARTPGTETTPTGSGTSCTANVTEDSCKSLSRFSCTPIFSFTRVSYE